MPGRRARLSPREYLLLALAARVPKARLQETEEGFRVRTPEGEAVVWVEECRVVVGGRSVKTRVVRGERSALRVADQVAALLIGIRY